VSSRACRSKPSLSSVSIRAGRKTGTIVAQDNLSSLSFLLCRAIEIRQDV
jgi:hypothetical protein